MLLIALVLLVLYFLTGSLQSPIQNAARDPIAFIAFLIAIVLGITVHEFMHAYAAHRLGDDTGRLLGRMTLNPLAHLDPFGTRCANGLRLMRPRSRPVSSPSRCAV